MDGTGYSKYEKALTSRDRKVMELLSLPAADKMVEELRAGGWSDWYHPNYWVNRSRVSEPSKMDYTKYGVSIPVAYVAMIGEWPPIKFGPFAHETAPKGSRFHAIRDEIEAFKERGCASG